MNDNQLPSKPDKPELHEESAQHHAQLHGRSECVHPVLAPRWDQAENPGDDALLEGYYCEECGAGFDSAEAEEMIRRMHAITM